MPKSPIAERATAPASFSSTARHDTGEREVTAAASDLVDHEPAATLPHREVDRGEDLVGLERGGPGALEEVGGRDAARRAGAGGLELGVERERDRGQLGGGVGMGDRTADGAAVADLEVADHRQRLGDERGRGGDGVVVLGDRLTGHGADREGPVLALDAAQLRRPG